MDTAIWVGLIIGTGGTIIELFRRSVTKSSKLMKAAEADDLEKFKNLLGKRKIKINAYGSNGNRPLHIAAGKWGKEGLIEEILSKGAVIDIRNIYKQTPLHFAAAFGRLDAIKTLIEHGADFQAKEANGFTPLQIAEKGKKKRTIELLKSYGAE